MKIAVDVAQTCAERAGCAWVSAALAPALAKVAGHSYLWYHHFGSWINGSTQAGIRPPIGREVACPFLGVPAEEARRMWDRISAGDATAPGEPDVVLSLSFHAPRIAGAKLVVLVHDVSFWLHPACTTELNRTLCQGELLRALRQASGLVFPSHSSKADFETMLPGWLSDTRLPSAVIPHASRFAPRARSLRCGASAPWLVVGSLEPRKNHSLLLEAYALYSKSVRSPRPLMFLGGAGWKSEAVQRRIAQWSGPGNVTWKGYTTDETLLDHYVSAHCLLQPSLHEGFGLPVVEASSADLPVIISDIGALSELVGPAAPRASPFDAKAWADLLITHHETPPPLVPVQPGRTWDAVANDYLAFIATIAR